MTCFVQVAGTKSKENRIQTDKNIRLCEQIATEYVISHTYSKDDVYDCDNMAQDVWDMLKAKGINAGIAVGNFESAEMGELQTGLIPRKALMGGVLVKLKFPAAVVET